MRNFIFIVLFLIGIISLNAQTIAYHENFEAPSFADSVTSTQTIPGTDDWQLSSMLAFKGIYSDSCSVTASSTTFLTTTPFSTLGTSAVYLDFAHICKVDFLDIARIEITVDNGSTWLNLTDSIYLGGSTNFAAFGDRFVSSSYGNDWIPGDNYALPDNSWWREEKFDLSSLASDKAAVMIRFNLQDGGTAGGNGNYGWLIDDIVISASGSELDPPMITFIPPFPNSIACYLGPYDIKAQITDASGIDTALLVYNVNYGLNDTLGMLMINTDTFLSVIPAVNDQDVVCYHVIAYDGSVSHNMAKEPASSCLSFIATTGLSLPYYDNFDTMNIWTATANPTTSQWELGTPAYGQTNSAYSNPNAWDINLATSYGANANAILTSPVFDFSYEAGATLSVWMNYYCTGNRDGVRLEYTTDGVNWDILGTQNDPLGTNWYNSAGLTSSGLPAWSGNPSGWVEATYDLSFLNFNAGNIQFRFIFTSDGVAQLDGCSIDNFSITIPPSQDAAIGEILTPGFGCGLDNETVSISIFNSGHDTIDGNLNANYRAIGGATVTEAVTGTIAPCDTLYYVFNTTIDMSTTLSDSTFEFIAWVDLMNDTVDNNDTTTLSVLSAYIPSPPIVSNVTIPYCNIANLTATSSDSIFWFDLPVGVYHIHTGHSYTTPLLYDTTVYYLEARNVNTGIKITEVCQQKNGSGYTKNYPPDVTATWAGVEITNLGISPVDLSGYTVHVEGHIELNYTIHNGVILDAGEILLLTIYSNGAAVDNPANNFYVMGDLYVNTLSSCGYYVKDPYGVVVDAVATIDYQFSVASGVTASDWSGSLYNYAGRAGVIRIISDNNLASDWIQSASTIFQTIGAMNPGLSIYGGNGCSSIRVPDTVFVGSTPSFDGSVFNIITPNSDLFLTSYDTVKVSITNHGTAAISNFPVSYSINEGVPVTETINDIINQGDTLVYEFSTPADLIMFGVYDFKAYISVPGDIHHLNDTSYKTVENVMPVYCTSNATSTLYDDIGNVTLSNLNNGIATPVTNNPNANQQYNDFTNLPPANLLIDNVHPISVSQITSTTTIQPCWIKVYIDYNKDGVFNEALEEVFAAQTSATDTTVYGLVDVPLNADPGLTIMRIVMERTSLASNVHSCGTYTYGETEDYLVMINPPVPKDAGVIEILQPNAVVNEGVSHPVEVTIKNFGADTITTMDIAYTINGGVPVITPWSGILAPSDATDVTLLDFIVPPSDNNICVYTMLVGDTNLYNNQRCKDFYGYPMFNPGAVALSNLPSGCGLGMETITLDIYNVGHDTIKSGLNASYYLVGGSNIVTEQVTLHIPPNDTVHFSFATLADLSVSLVDSTFEIVSYVSMASDWIKDNDTTGDQIFSAYVPPDPVVTNVNIPYATSTTLTATSLDSIFWYDTPTGGVEIGLGANYKTPVLFGTEVYWAQARSGNVSGVIITEIGLGNDFVEIQNVNNYPIDLTGWFVAISDSYNDINIVNSITWDLSTMLAGEVDYRDDQTGTHYWGKNILYNANENSWVMIVDDKGEVQDFVVWGYTAAEIQSMNVTINGYNITIGSEWIGDGISNFSADVLERITYDNDDSSDFINTSYSNMGQANPNLQYTGVKGCLSNRVPDTVFVSAITPYDLSVVKIIEPLSDYHLTNSEPVTILVKNYGTQSVSAFSVTYKVDNGLPVTETINQTLNPGDSVIHYFSQHSNLNQFGIYNFKAYVSYPLDATQQNDTAYASVENKMLIYCPSYATQPADYEDIGNVTISNLNNGNPLPNSNNPTAINGYTDFTNLPPVQLEAGVLYPISISKISSSLLHGCSTNVYIDYNRNGLFDLPEENPFSAYTSNLVPTASGDIIVPLWANPGVAMMRVVLDHNTSAAPCGTYLWGETEDYTVMLGPPISQDAGVTEIIQPVAVIPEASLVPVRVVVENFGSDTIFSMLINYELNGGPPVSNIWNGAFAPNTTDTVSLSAIVVPALDNHICVYPVLNGDINDYNDETCKDFYGDPLQNAEAYELSQPVSASGLGIEDVTLRIVNLGLNDINGNLNANYQTNGGTTVTEAVTATIIPGDTLDYTFITPIDMSTTISDSTFEFVAWVDLMNDPIPSNDTVKESIISYHNPYYCIASILINKLPIDSFGLCLGESIDLTTGYADGNYNALMLNDFNNGTVGTGWYSNATPMFNNPCPPLLPPASGIVCWMGSATNFPRELTTVAYDLSSIGYTIEFDMKYGDVQTSVNCEDPDAANEGVYLQYSVDSAVTWHTIQYWTPNSSITGPLYIWTHYFNDVPPAAYSSHTQFRWYQDLTSGFEWDHWGVDNIRIKDPGKLTFNWSTGDTTSSTIVSPTQTTTYYLTITNDSSLCTDSVTIYNLVPGSCGCSITDSRDGNTYKTVLIGSQCWMQENLAYLPSVSPSGDSSSILPYYYVYGYQGTSDSAAKATINYQNYGVLYNWPAVMEGEPGSNTVPSGVQGICPTGWHLPSDEEWKTLEGEVDGQYGYPDPVWNGTGLRGTNVGGCLKDIGISYWDSPNSGATNSSRFTALPGGYRNFLGNFINVGKNVSFWSSAEFDSSYVWSRRLNYNNSRVYRSHDYKSSGYYVRCLRPDSNTTVTVTPTYQTVSPSQDFTSKIEISQVQNLGGFELDIGFDPLLLQANNAVLETYLGSTGRPVVLLSNNIDNINGIIEFAATTLGASPPGPDGNGMLLTIEWDPIDSISVQATTEISLQNVQVKEPNGNNINVRKQNALVNISPCYIHDFDCDCDVDIVDITMAAYCYGTSVGNPLYNPVYDLDSDGDIDIVDITMVAYDYGWSCSKKGVIKKLGDVNEGVILGISSNEDSLGPDGLYEIEIYTENINQLGAYEFSLSFDPNCMEVMSIEKSDLLERNGRRAFPVEEYIDNKIGEVRYAITTLGSDISGASGSGTLLSLTCKAHRDECLMPELTKGQLVQIDGEIIDYKLKVQNVDIENDDETCILNSYPVPFNEEINIQYRVAEKGKISFKVFDIMGKKIMETEPVLRGSGTYKETFNRDGLNSGLYFYILEHNDIKADSKKILII